MKERYDLILRNVSPMGGERGDVGIRDGKIVNIVDKLDGFSEEVDGDGAALLPGLTDHHIHLLATAARMSSIDLEGVTDPAEITRRLRAAAAGQLPGTWLRATGYDEAAAGLLTRDDVDRWRIFDPLRIQDRTGALWILNSPGIERLGSGPFPDCVERDAKGVPNGRIWRGDAWLRERIGSVPPSLAPLSQALAKQGVTSVTDAGANNGPAEAALLGGARQDGSLLQKLTIMGRPTIPLSPHYEIGPVKILFDERDLPDVAAVAAMIGEARAVGRAVAAHCVTAAELILYLEALEAAGGTRPGDRIEHGGMIPQSYIAEIAAAGLIVVTQPHFIHDRGDRYLREVARDELPDLYRLRSLTEGGVKLAAGSDAPYGTIDPWIAIRTAGDRLTRERQAIGSAERIDVAAALSLYMGTSFQPAQPRTSIRVGDAADLCLVDCSLETLLEKPDASRICATTIGGKIAYLA